MSWAWWGILNNKVFVHTKFSALTVIAHTDGAAAIRPATHTGTRNDSVYSYSQWLSTYSANDSIFKLASVFRLFTNNDNYCTCFIICYMKTLTPLELVCLLECAHACLFVSVWISYVQNDKQTKHIVQRRWRNLSLEKILLILTFGISERCHYFALWQRYGNNHLRSQHK